MKTKESSAAGIPATPKPTTIQWEIEIGHRNADAVASGKSRYVAQCRAWNPGVSWEADDLNSVVIRATTTLESTIAQGQHLVVVVRPFDPMYRPYDCN